MEGASRQQGSRYAAWNPLRGTGDYAPAGALYFVECAAEFEQLRVAVNVGVGVTLPGLLLPYQHEFWRRMCIGSRSLYPVDRQRRGI